ncbi:MAG: metallophosphoesterase family protein [Armatimonadetes bacterium]|nr:metallophosphoesterase family protein [Armatimonadota bacterium]
MRFGIFGDIHGNLPGLQAVLAAIRTERVQHLICTGDMVGYGAEPNACCELLRSTGAVCLLGNHDQACVSDVEMNWFNPYARSAVDWTREHLDPNHREWLATLAPVARAPGFLLVHSSLPEPGKWVYITSPEIAWDTMQAADRNLIFVGHTHVAEAYRKVAASPVRRVQFRDGGEVFINNGNRYVINPGSCGQPRDRNWRAAYAIYDDAEGKVTFRRVVYDVDAACERIRQVGLPESLAHRLHVGS